MSGWVRSPSKRADRGRLVGRPWSRLRMRVIQRDFGLCQVCKAKGLIRGGHEVDHIMNAGGDDMDNLQTICVPCHRAKTQIEARKGKKL
jgi:5-methylcytosine-specific restriction protein A